MPLRPTPRDSTAQSQEMMGSSCSLDSAGRKPNARRDRGRRCRDSAGASRKRNGPCRRPNPGCRREPPERTRRNDRRQARRRSAGSRRSLRSVRLSATSAPARTRTRGPRAGVPELAAMFVVQCHGVTAARAPGALRPLPFAASPPDVPQPHPPTTHTRFASDHAPTTKRRLERQTPYAVRSCSRGL